MKNSHFICINLILDLVRSLTQKIQGNQVIATTISENRCKHLSTYA